MQVGDEVYFVDPSRYRFPDSVEEFIRVYGEGPHKITEIRLMADGGPAHFTNPDAYHGAVLELGDKLFCVDLRMLSLQKDRDPLDLLKAALN